MTIIREKTLKHCNIYFSCQWELAEFITNEIRNSLDYKINHAYYGWTKKTYSGHAERAWAFYERYKYTDETNKEQIIQFSLMPIQPDDVQKILDLLLKHKNILVHEIEVKRIYNEDGLKLVYSETTSRNGEYVS